MLFESLVKPNIYTAFPHKRGVPESELLNVCKLFFSQRDCIFLYHYSAKVSFEKKKKNLNPSCPVHLRNLHCIFISTLLCGASNGFIKAFKAFIKPFEAPQRSMKIKNLS